MKKNGTMMQYFEWYLPAGMLWKQIAEQAEELKNNGITALWIPPPYKGSSGIKDVGYAVYDLYDLGEFDQKGTVPTKYGTKDELLAAIQAAHQHGMQVYADIVLDHKMGADATETVAAKEYNPENRNEQEGASKEVTVWTHFTFPGRNKKYSDFEWHWNDFVAIDWDEKRDEKGIFKFRGKEWQENVDGELGNYDYLMGADIDLNNPDVVEELTKWGYWFLKTTDVDGFRLDAVKHMEFTFYRDWLETLRKEVKEELFSVGEYWQSDYNALKNYIETTEGTLSLFDVPLHFKFSEASNQGNKFDMRTIFDGTLTKDDPLRSVTFVDNHDTQPGQSLESWVQDWFKPLAYALTLLRAEGYPCVFYGDYYGIPHNNIQPKKDMLVPLLKARELYAYGEQHDYFDHANTIGWTREGDDEHEGSGLAVVLTNGSSGDKVMYVGKKFAGHQFRDYTGNRTELVAIGEDGNGKFPVNGGSVSVWVDKKD
ncbi:alpha-amylase [Breznakiella homolactica]|uniref:Alpha-amylase n=1 Tax=Breznakiella homolactica TaxID=2798577 RepID=A0A7T7XMH1_9SPIR|nr:alpha-amylase [Breznakiella homolactica]QQO09084.1 alpha-amylase [Breznakiella homolactica]